MSKEGIVRAPVDAIHRGDTEALRRLLREDPRLTTATSDAGSES